MKIIYRNPIPFGTKLLVWIQILIQTAFPLVAAFTTPNVVAGNGPYSLKHTTEISSPQTHVDQQRVAEIASQAGRFLASNPNSDAVMNMTRSITTGFAGDKIQQWLNQFGVARVQLDVDKKFSLKNSQFDLLVPLYEQKENIVFSQGSLHRTDDRSQLNLGLGYRWFADDWMLGGNGFFDYDLSRDHARIGMGIEYWRDFFKVGINGYWHLTRWKKSPDVVDYDERPANGWDIDAQAWPPYCS